MIAQSSRRMSESNAAGAVQKFWKKQSKNILPPVLGILSFLIIWQLISSSGITRLPGPISLFIG